MKEQLTLFLAFAARQLSEANTKSDKITVLDHIATVGKALTQYASTERKRLVGSDKGLVKAFIYEAMAERMEQQRKQEQQQQLEQ